MISYQGFLRPKLSLIKAKNCPQLHSIYRQKFLWWQPNPHLLNLRLFSLKNHFFGQIFFAVFFPQCRWWFPYSNPRPWVNMVSALPPCYTFCPFLRAGLYTLAELKIEAATLVCFKGTTNMDTPTSGNTNWRGRLSMIDLLIKVACFVKKLIMFNINSNWCKLVQGGQLYWAFPFSSGVPANIMEQNNFWLSFKIEGTT